MRFSRSLALAVSLFAIYGCAWQHPSTDGPRMDVPSGVGSTQPYLYQAQDGTLWMSWIEAVDSVSHAFRFASYEERSWSDAKTLLTDSTIFSNWADIPKLLVMPDGSVVGQYSVNNGHHYFATDLVQRRMAPDGWVGMELRLHDDETATQHGFGSLASIEEGALSVWLDGRTTKLIEGEYDESAWGDMQLRAALVGGGNTIQHRWLLDERVCECCGTRAVRTSNGVLVAYRDRGEDERRDIKLLRYEDGRWSRSYSLHDDGWIFNGCPVNGPALAAVGDNVAAVWFTAANDSPRVQVAFSEDEGRTFGPPMVVDDARPKGRADIVLLTDRSALVLWIGVENRMNAIMVAHVTADAGVGNVSTVVFPKSTAFTGMPQMARSGDDVVIAWVDGGHPDSTEIFLERRPIAELR